jgi:lysophospholipase L1-like esterase
MPDRRRPPWWLAGVAVVLAVLAVAAALGLRAANRDDGAANRDDRLDMALVGDSFADQAQASFLAHAATDRKTAEVSAYGGIGVCDRVDALADIAQRSPRVLILSFAGNDITPCMLRTDTPSTAEETAEEYQSDLESVLADFRAASPDTRVYVVPPPPIRDAQFETNAAAMRDMYARLVDEFPDIAVIDVTGQLGPDQQFHVSLPCEDWEDAWCQADGMVVLRQDDGIHLSPAGAERYTRAVLEAIGGG